MKSENKWKPEVGDTVYTVIWENEKPFIAHAKIVVRPSKKRTLIQTTDARHPNWEKWDQTSIRAIRREYQKIFALRCPPFRQPPNIKLYEALENIFELRRLEKKLIRHGIK